MNILYTNLFALDLFMTSETIDDVCEEAAQLEFAFKY